MHLEGRTLSGIGNGVAAGALWGSVFLAPQLLSGFSPAQLSVARYLIYGAFSLLLLIPRWKTLPHLGKNEWFALCWLSILGNSLYYVLLSEGIHLAGGAPTSLIVGLLPVVVTVVGTRSSGAVKLRSLILPTLLCCIGVGLISYHSFRVGTPGTDFTHKVIGFLCAFCALVSWSAYAIGNCRCLMRLPHISAHEWSLLTGVVTGAIAVIQGSLVFLFDAAPLRIPVHVGTRFHSMWAPDSVSCGRRFRSDVGSIFLFTVIGAHIA